MCVHHRLFTCSDLRFDCSAINPINCEQRHDVFVEITRSGHAQPSLHKRRRFNQNIVRGDQFYIVRHESAPAFACRDMISVGAIQ